MTDNIRTLNHATSNTEICSTEAFCIVFKVHVLVSIIRKILTTQIVTVLYLNQQKITK